MEAIVAQLMEQLNNTVSHVLFISTAPKIGSVGFLLNVLCMLYCTVRLRLRESESRVRMSIDVGDIFKFLVVIIKSETRRTNIQRLAIHERVSKHHSWEIIIVRGRDGIFGT